MTSSSALQKVTDETSEESSVSSTSSSSSKSAEQGEGDNNRDDDWQNDANPLGRRQIESEGSEYAPSSLSSSAPEVARDVDNPHQEDLDKRSSPNPLKRPAPTAVGYAPSRPLKRIKGAFNRDYLGVLNTDIQDVVSRYVPHEMPDLHQTQIGLTVWTPAEKEIFFESLSRLGRDGVEEIARRIQTKSALEVGQYLKLLDDALTHRRARQRNFPHLQMADFPSATEIGTECCQGLEAAADALSLRQEKHEDTQEQKRWGRNWIITPLNYQSLDKKAAEMSFESLQLFKIENWLKLSERIFMNSPDDEANWQAAGELPSIRTTALEDFYTIAVSITKRLISATLYMSMSRIRGKSAALSWTRKVVRKADVAAAVMSLGLPANNKLFWVELPRRLKLKVYKDIPDFDDPVKPMSYVDVEMVLAERIEEYQAPSDDNDPMELSSDDDEASASDSSSLNIENLIKKENVDAVDNNVEGSASANSYDSETRLDAKEITYYSVLGYKHTSQAKKSVMTRIWTGRQEEAFADTVDLRASYDAELEMWAVLDRDPPEALVKPEESVRPVTGGDLDDWHPVGKGWRKRLRHVSEWETMPLEEAVNPVPGQNTLPVAPEDIAPPKDKQPSTDAEGNRDIKADRSESAGDQDVAEASGVADDKDTGNTSSGTDSDSEMSD